MLRIQANKEVQISGVYADLLIILLAKDQATKEEGADTNSNEPTLPRSTESVLAN